MREEDRLGSEEVIDTERNKPERKRRSEVRNYMIYNSKRGDRRWQGAWIYMQCQEGGRGEEGFQCYSEAMQQQQAARGGLFYTRRKHSAVAFTHNMVEEEEEEEQCG